MKVAVPTSSGIVSSTFARSPEFSFFEVNDVGVVFITSEANPFVNEARGVGPLVTRWLYERGVEVVVAPNVGPNAADILASLGIKWLPTQPGIRAEDAVKMALSGELSSRPGIFSPTIGEVGPGRGAGRRWGWRRGFMRGFRGRLRRWE